jgi:hypothetical protein
MIDEIKVITSTNGNRREFMYKGFRITLWSKSFRVDGCPVIYMGDSAAEFGSKLEETIKHVLATALRNSLRL